MFDVYIIYLSLKPLADDYSLNPAI